VSFKIAHHSPRARCSAETLEGKMCAEMRMVCGTRMSALQLHFGTSFALYEKSKFLGSGGSMVARLKLYVIDGRAPSGVEPAA
jgi:hypothetical protein